MNKLFALKTSVIAVAMLALPVAFAATITKAEYNASKARIGANYKTDKAACGALSGNAKDICGEEAKGKQTVARAELEYALSAKSADQNKVLVAKAKATYAVAKERCDDKSGNVKDVCVQEAKAAETKALADAKMGKQIVEAKKEAATDKRDADYKVAVEKCDVMSGDAKSSCMTTAKATYGKN